MKIKRVNELNESNNLQEQIENEIKTFEEYRGIGQTANGYIVFLSEDNQTIRNLLDQNFSDVNIDIKIGQIVAY